MESRPRPWHAGLLPWVPLRAPALASRLPPCSRLRVSPECRLCMASPSVTLSFSAAQQKFSTVGAGRLSGETAEASLRSPGGKPRPPARAVQQLRMPPFIFQSIGFSSEPQTRRDFLLFRGLFVPDRHHHGCGVAKVKISVILALLSKEGQPAIGRENVSCALKK